MESETRCQGAEENRGGQMEARAVGLRAEQQQRRERQEAVVPVGSGSHGVLSEGRVRTFDGPCRAVSTPPIAGVGACFSGFFLDLQDLHYCAPLET